MSETAASGGGLPPGRPDLAAPPPLDPALFDLDPESVWLMHCAEGPIPRAAAEAVRTFLGKELRPWELSWTEDFEGIPTAVRSAGARVLGGVPSDVTLTTNTSSGLQIVARGLRWEAGDEVVVPLGEFPSNLWPWKSLAALGVELREVALWKGHRAGAAAWESTPAVVDPADRPEDRLLAALGPRTRVLAVSWVRFQDGLGLDLGRLAAGCAVRKVHLVVDGIQGAGTRQPSLDGVAAFATGGHKGLLAPQGQGLLWTSPSFRESLVPEGTWLSVEEAADWSRPSTDHDRAWLGDGRRLEAGTPNLLGCAALLPSLELLAEVGVGRLARWIAALRGRLLEGLAAEGPEWLRGEAERLAALHERRRLGSIVALHHGGRGPEGLAEVLRAGRRAGIHASVREGYLRLAFHGWHGAADVDRVLDWLRTAG